MQYYPDTINNGVADENAVNAYVARVFGWMFIGLMVTCLTTVAIMYGMEISYEFSAFIYNLSQGIFIIFIAQVIIVGAVSVRVTKMNPLTAKLLYLLYAGINGFTIGLFAVIYAANNGGAYTLGMAAGITALSFGIMAVYGFTTKTDVTKAGNLLKMGLIGLIILSVVNIFIGSGGLDFIICVAGLFIFLGLTAYDTKKIKSHYAQAALYGAGQGEYGRHGLDQQALASNLAIVGALMLYLDFINIFLFILRLLGGGRR